jgi:hypothetical protein
MKRALLVLLACSSLYVASAQTLKTPAPSSTQSIKQEFGLGSIELSYSRPNVKGRKIFGDLVPFGKVWRTGANGATTLTFTEEVTIGGTKIAPGKYGLLSIPDQKSWTLIITKQIDVTSPAAYKQSEDLVRVTGNTESTASPFETLTMQFEDVTATSMNLVIVWDKTVVTLPIKTDIDTKVTGQIEEMMNGDNRPYFAAASYYFDNNKDLKKAREWAQKATTQNPKAYYMFYLLARIEAKQGDKAAAIETAKKSIELAKEGRNDDYVALNEKLIASLK